MNFMETATAFDNARRDAARKVRDMKLVVNGSLSCEFGIPSIRWPYHITVVDGSNGKRIVGASCRVLNQKGSQVFAAKTSRDGTAFGMIELGTAGTLCVEMLTADYLPYSVDISTMVRKRSPLLIFCTLCPRPPVGSARAILSWNKRCWLDFHLQISSEDANSSFHVWKQEINGSGAKMDLLSKDGLGPASCTFKILPNATYKFHVVQYGNFQFNKSTMYKLGSVNLEFFCFDHSGLIVHRKFPSNATGTCWEDVPEIQTDERGRCVNGNGT